MVFWLSSIRGADLDPITVMEGLKDSILEKDEEVMMLGQVTGGTGKVNIKGIDL